MLLATILFCFISTIHGGTVFLSSPSIVIPQVELQRTSPHIVSAPTENQDLSHPAVVENALAEAQLPPQLLNPFYKNAPIASALAKESWFTNKEFPIHHREAEKIPRQKIYDMISRLNK